jgi:hypothetical protein
MAIVEIIFPLLMGIISLFFWPLFLMISTKIFKTQNKTYKIAFKVLLWPIIISTIFSIILNFISNQALLRTLWVIVGIGLLILNLWLIKTNYHVNLGRAFIISLIAGLMGIIPYLFIAVIMGFIMAPILLFSGQYTPISNESSYIRVPACSNPWNPLNLSANESDDCYAGIASGTNDASFCDKIKDENIKESCYQTVAMSINDSAPCDKIESINMKELCYDSVGSFNYNPLVCENIKEPNLKNQCFATAKNDTSYCANVREDMKVYPCTS